MSPSVRFGLRLKLLAGFGVVLLLMTVVGAFGLATAKSISDRLADVNNNAFPSAVAAFETQLALTQAQRDIRSAILVTSDQDTATYVTAYKADIAATEKAFADFSALPATDAEKQLDAKYQTDYKAWLAILNSAVPEVLKNTPAGNKAAEDIVINQATPARLAITQDLNNIVKLQIDDAASSYKTSSEAFQRSLIILAGIIVFGLAAGIIIALAIANGVTASVKKVQGMLESMANNCATFLAAGLQAIAAGDLTMKVVGVTHPIEQYGTDEVGRMSAIANGMLGKLQDTIGSYETARAKLQGIIGQIQTAAGDVATAATSVEAAARQNGGAVQEVARAVQDVAASAQSTSDSATRTNDAVKELSIAIDSIARGSTEQSEKVQAAAQTSDEMAEGVGNVAHTALQVASTSEKTRTSAQSGAKAVQDTVTGMAEIQEVVAQASGKVEELGRLGEKIGAVVETIDDIAEQTNLLALNAAIEAARAGEHGMGFAVVADEVRKLAERSQRETKAIGDLIKEVQEGTANAVRAMENGSAKVTDGSQRADQAGKALTEILQAVETTVEQVQAIAAASQQMANSSQEVTLAMKGINFIVEQNSAATEEMAAQAVQVLESVRTISDASQQQSAATEEVSASAEEMSAQVEEIAAQSEQLSRVANNLEGLVAQFKVESHESADPRATADQPRLRVLKAS